MVAQSGNRVLIRNARVFDGVRDGLADGHVLVDGNKIVPMSSIEPDAAAATVIDAATGCSCRVSPMPGVKAAIDEGIADGPRIYPSQAMISQTAGHGDFGMPYDRSPSLGGPHSRGDRISITRVSSHASRSS